MTSPSDRIVLIRKSQTIFVCGLMGLVPIVGFIPAILAIGHAVRLNARLRREWNRASEYVRAGVATAVLGAGISVLAGLIALLNLIPPFVKD